MYFNYEWTINGYIYLGEIMERNISTKLLNFSRKLNKYLKLDTSPNYGEIKNPLEHVNHRYGNGWTYSSINILELFEPINMNDFTASDHCTLSSLTAIFRYYKKLGYLRFPKGDMDVFKGLFATASADGYYEESVGTYPWRMAKIANIFLKDSGYMGLSKNQFIFLGENHIVSILKGEIDAGRPGLINFAHGSYKDHTVTYYGYMEFMRDNERKFYLLVNNNWNTNRVFVDVSRIGQLNTPFSITKIRIKNNN